MTYPDMVIALAWMAVVLHGDATRTAVKWFTTQCRENRFKVPTNPTGFLRFWHKHVDADGNIIRSGGKAGRRSALTPLLVDKAYKGIMEWAKAGRSKPYESHTELEEECPEVQAVLGEAGVTIGTLVKAIKAKHPKFGRRKLIIRHKLSDANKQHRITTCTELLARPARDKHRVVFIDAKSISMVEKSLYGYVDLAESRAVEGIRPATHKSKPISVKYYAAVNARLGPVLLTCYTGSSGLDNNHNGKDYKTTKGNKAQGITSAEFNDYITSLLQELERRRGEAGLRRGEKWILCFDDARVHSHAAEAMGTRAERWPQPPHSPDMQKVIEHVHGQLDKSVHIWLRNQRKTDPRVRISPSACQQEVQAAFNRLKAESIMRDVNTLPDTWQAIVAAGGSYVSPELS